jgi:hypothetical protein
MDRARRLGWRGRTKGNEPAWKEKRKGGRGGGPGPIEWGLIWAQNVKRERDGGWFGDFKLLFCFF